jgi:hypothetical protein
MTVMYNDMYPPYVEHQEQFHKNEPHVLTHLTSHLANDKLNTFIVSNTHTWTSGNFV